MATIQTKFSNDNARNNFSKLDGLFINSFYSFLKSINCSSVTINSTFRHGTESSHSYGLAVDIDNLVANNKTYYFNMWYGKLYNDKDDEFFFNSARKFFGKTLHNYYSPAIVMHAGSNPINNTFRYVSDKKAAWTKAGNIQPEKRNIHEQHLNHLHIAVDPQGRIKKGIHKIVESAKGSSGLFGLFILAVAGGFGYYYYKKEGRLINEL